MSNTIENHRTTLSLAILMSIALSALPLQGEGYRDWLKKDASAASRFDTPKADEPETEPPVAAPADRPSAEPPRPVEPPEQPAHPQPLSDTHATAPAQAMALARDGSSPLHPFVKRAVLGLHEGKDASESNYVCVINSGINALILRLHLIRNAKVSIDVQTFIYDNDEVGRLLTYEFIQAAKRGVKVRIIADHLASARDREAIAFLATVHPNLRIKHYRPVAGRMEPSQLQETIDGIIPNRTNQRMHNKLFLVDDMIGITGGRNIENCYYDFSTQTNFKDRDVMLIGPVALDMKVSFNAFWNFKHSVSSRDLPDVRSLIKSGKYSRPETLADFHIDSRFDTVNRLADSREYIQEAFAHRLVKPRRVVLLADKPGKNRKFFFFSGGGRITEQLAETLQLAEESLVIQSPYLVLDRKARKLLRSLKKKHDGLRIILSSNSFSATDSVIAYSANYRMRSSYIEDVGVEVYEYKPHPEDLLHVLPSFPELEARAQEEGKEKRPHLCIHAKSLVIDDRHTFIGSYNLDPRSANLNTELGLLIDDPVVATWVKNDILRDCLPRNSWVIAKRRMPLNLDDVNRLVEGTLRHTPLDIWPIRNTTSFDLIPNRPAVPPFHPDFYDCYRETGDFPGASKDLSGKEIITRILKVISSPAQGLF
ncbi:MAG: phospholipase D family protein [Lentisphaerae bacterium]|nr:phospholipase D family protein [Lentisphaerota bacterium]